MTTRLISSLKLLMTFSMRTAATTTMTTTAIASLAVVVDKKLLELVGVGRATAVNPPSLQLFNHLELAPVLIPAFGLRDQRFEHTVV